MAISESFNSTLQVFGTGIAAAIASQAPAATVAGTECSLVASLAVPNSPTSITLPGSPVNGLYIKNTHASQTLTVTWTPNGGASAVVLTLEPGSLILFMEAAASGGITALSLQGSGANTTCDYLLVA